MRLTSLINNIVTVTTINHLIRSLSLLEEAIDLLLQCKCGLQNVRVEQVLASFMLALGKCLCM